MKSVFFTIISVLGFSLQSYATEKFDYVRYNSGAEYFFQCLLPDNTTLTAKNEDGGVYFPDQVIQVKSASSSRIGNHGILNANNGYFKSDPYANSEHDLLIDGQFIILSNKLQGMKIYHLEISQPDYHIEYNNIVIDCQGTL